LGDDVIHGGGVGDDGARLPPPERVAHRRQGAGQVRFVPGDQVQARTRDLGMGKYI
jgi:hypothetical protein